MISLKAKLSFSYVMVAIIAVCILSVIANVFLERLFQDYIKQNQENKNKQVAALIKQQYQGDDRWKQGTIQEIGINALEQGMIIRVTDERGRVIWDATVHNNGLCQQMINHMAENMASRYPNFRGGYRVNNYPVHYQFREVGRVEIGYYGPYYFNDTDLAFITTLNRILIGVAVITLLFALGAGMMMARNLSSPIARVIAAADKIAKGDLGDRIRESSDIREINQLTGAINELAASLQNQEMLRKRLTADVAHELRTPLATVQSHLEAMIDGIWPADQARLKSCHEEIERIARMVKDLRRLAKYEGEELELHESSFDLGALVRGIALNFEPEFKAKGVALELRTEAEPIRADRDKLSQVAVNLIANALKYTNPGGKVTVETGRTDADLMLKVSDTGIGIALEDLPYIFERFYRADKSRNRLSGGSGIGLAIVKAIVDAHRGRISVESELGSGTAFTVFFPERV